MVFIDVGYLFSFDFLQTSTVNDSVCNVMCICKPNRVVLIFQKLAMHSYNFNVVKLRDEIANFNALKLAVLLLIVLNKLNIFSIRPEIVDYLALRVLPVDFGIELHKEGNTKARLSLQTGLDARDILVSLVFS